MFFNDFFHRGFAENEKREKRWNIQYDLIRVQRIKRPEPPRRDPKLITVQRIKCPETFSGAGKLISVLDAKKSVYVFIIIYMYLLDSMYL